MIGPLEDHEANPILTPGSGFEAKAVYNPAVIVAGGVFHMLYRAESGDGCTGRIGLAHSNDGVNFTRHPRPVIEPEYDFEAVGCEDPRITREGNTFYLTYVGRDRNGVFHVCLATSSDLVCWEKQGVLLSPKYKWNRRQIKAGAVAHGRVNGSYVMYFLGETRRWETAIGIAFSDDMRNWEEPLDKPVMTPRAGHFDDKGVEPGSNPIPLEGGGLLMIYAGWSDDNICKAGAVIFSDDDPTEVLWRSERPILAVNWGMRLGCANHVMPESLVWYGDRWWFYYGAADRVVCLATFPGDKLRPRPIENR